MEEVELVVDIDVLEGIVEAHVLAQLEHQQGLIVFPDDLPEKHDHPQTPPDVGNQVVQLINCASVVDYVRALADCELGVYLVAE